MFYIRKLSKLNTINKIKYANDVNDIPADVLKQEFPTTGNTLSFWKFESFDYLSDSITAILLSGRSIEKSKFIIVDDVLLNKYDLKTDFSEPGKTGYIGFEDTHVNICELTYGKIGNVLKMIKDIIDKDDYIREYNKDEIKQLIEIASVEGKIDFESLDEHLASDLSKYNLLH